MCVLRFKYSDWKKSSWKKIHFFVKNPSNNQGKHILISFGLREKVIENNKKVRKNSGKIKTQNCHEPWSVVCLFSRNLMSLLLNYCFRMLNSKQMYLKIGFHEAYVTSSSVQNWLKWQYDQIFFCLNITFKRPSFCCFLS